MNADANDLRECPEEYCAMLEYLLLGDLRDLLEESASAETSNWLCAVLDALMSTLRREFDNETARGYLSLVLERYPSWDLQVARLQEEQEALYERLREFREGVVRGLPYAESVSALRHDLREWMAALIAHHRHENRLVQTAVNLDVGGECS